jgi:hypothetical protein
VRRVSPDVAEGKGPSAAREGARQLALGAAAALGAVERLSGGVLFEDPQVQPAGWPAPGHGAGGLGEEACADSVAFEVVPDVEIVEESAPDGVFVEDGVRETGQGAAKVGDDGVPVWCGPGEPVGPFRHPVGDDVAVEVGVQERAPVVTLPAVGVQAGDGFGVARGCLSVVHIPMLADIRHPGTGPGAQSAVWASSRLS